MMNGKRFIPSSRRAAFGVFTTVAVLITAILLSQLYEEAPALTVERGLGLLAFVFLAVLSEGYPLRVPFGNAFLGLSGTIFWALIVLFHPYWAAVCGLISLLVSEFFIHKRALAKGLFNGTQTAVSILVGSLLFRSLAQQSGLYADFNFFFAFGLAALGYWLTNTWLVSIGANILYGESSYRFWERNFKWAFPYELTSVPIALAVAYAYQELWLMGLLLVTLPIMMVRLAYSQYLQLKKTYRETVRTLIKIIEMHDPYTAGHSDRVAAYTRMMCDSLRLSPTETEKIELAAFLHDLGKINLDLSGIVRKAGQLSDEERRLIKLHSVVSADLAYQVSYFRGEIEAMIRHHHENWDGSGYPHGLKGEEIPLGSRIILLADAFDAMTTSRVYREALDVDDVKQEFHKFAGIQFDPALVPVFVDSVIGDGSSLIRKPLDEPLEGERERARSQEKKSFAGVRPISRSVVG